MTSVRISFTHFWPGFDPARNLFSEVLRQRLGLTVEVVDPHQDCDLAFHSVFAFSSTTDRAIRFAKAQFRDSAAWDYADRAHYGFTRTRGPKQSRRVWYTGENRCAPRGVFDATISFDVQDSLSRNLYFPYWMYRLDWGLDIPAPYFQPTPVQLSNSRPPNIRPRTACAFSNTRQPGKLRLAGLVGECMPMAGFGRAYAEPVQDKHETASRFGFQVCPENSLTPGYVTEKLFEAWSSGNVPIWMGLDRDKLINPRAFLDMTSRTDQQVRDLLLATSDDDAIEIRRQPLLHEPASITPLVDLLADLVG